MPVTSVEKDLEKLTMTIVADFLLTRRRAAATLGILFIAVFSTPALITGATPSLWLFLAVAAIWLGILRARTASSGE